MSTSSAMYLLGASGHAKVIIDILQDSGVTVAGLFDDNPAIKQLAGIPVLGSFTKQTLDAPLLISIGSNRIRAKFSQALHVQFGQAIHSSAIVSPSVCIGEGTVVMQGAIMQAGATVGKHVIINTGASIDHDCKVADYVHISPKAVLSGGVTVGEGTHIGAGAVVIQGISIGKWCTIGAGAVVIRDIPDYSTAVGNPSRILNK